MTIKFYDNIELCKVFITNEKYLYDKYNKNHETKLNVSGVIIENTETEKYLKELLNKTNKKERYLQLCALKERLEESLETKEEKNLRKTK